MNRGFALILLISSCSASAASKVLPVLQHQIPDQRSGPGQPTRSIALNQHFGAEPIDDQVVRFSYPTPGGGSPLVVDMALFTSKTPVTRTNFLGYVARGDYNNSIIHRHVPGFVLQGGGYGIGADNLNYVVPQQAPIINEYGASNTYGTVAMAKIGGNPHSATSEWFINLAENSDNLNNQNGGFTVFAKITKSTLPAITTLTNTNNYPLFNGGGAWASIPLHRNFVPYLSSRRPNSDEYQLANPVALAPISPSDAGESTALTYSITTSPSAGLANVTLSGNTVSIVPNPSQTAAMTVKITATDSVGNTVEDTFRVLLPYAGWRTASFSTANAADEAISGPAADPDGDGIKNLQLFLHGLAPGAITKPPVAASNSTVDSQQRPLFTFPIRNDIIGASYTIETTGNLTEAASWTTVPHKEVSRTTSGILDTVTIQPTTAVSAAPAFYRMRFSVQ